MEGYNALAAVMGTSPELNVFRGFKALSARNVMMLQGELTLAEVTLQQTIMDDYEACQKDDKSTQWFQREVKELLDGYDEKDGSNQWTLTLKVRDLLKQYRSMYPTDEALFYHSWVIDSAQPNSYDRNVLREWLRDSRGGKNAIRGLESDTWSVENEADLVALVDRYKNKDVLTKWIDQHVIRRYHHYRGHKTSSPIQLPQSWHPNRVPSPLHNYNDDVIAKWLDAFGTILSSSLLGMSIFVLYFITNPLARLAAIVAFSFIFSAALTLIAKVNRLDCFACTAAIAAVQVVYISTSNGSGSSG